ncbi:hypothetical protein [Desulfuromonas acetoxidans]|uniref:hypothetical protein n=1 Tax=Desulfuromonas acetoxidans TaxID=891 RepID=UPI0029307B6D|nr:hypothetical protein [Desulfuromonas acetoxidans]
MPIDDLAEGFFKISGRFIGRVLIDVLFEFVCYWVGWAFLRLVTVGKYPKDTFNDAYDTVCSVVGFCIILPMGYAAIYWMT